MSTRDVDASETAQADALRRRQPLARGIELLTLMVDSDQDSHGVRELAGRLDVSPSTVHRLITDLEKLGLVSRNPTGSYRLGLEFLRLAWTTTHRYPVQDVATDTLERLTRESGESSFFGIYNEQRREMMLTATVESPHPLRYTLPVQAWLPLHAGASGLAILAFLPEAIRQQIVLGPLAAATDRTLIDPPTLLARLAEIRRDGYAISRGERIEGAMAVAAPVFGLTGVAGVIGISLPESRFDAAHAGSFAGLVRDAATHVSGFVAGG
jgi:IclR family transcriptional regulator, acetate operon repressor